MDEIKNSDYPSSIKRYLNNPNLKAAEQEIEFTEEQVAEYIKCKEDPVYFIKKYVKIRTLDGGLEKFALWDFQEDLVEKLNDNRFVIAKFPRQVGKSTTVVAFFLWVVLFHQFNELAILAHKRDAAIGILNRLRVAYEYIPLWMQQGVVQWNKSYIELENNSSIIAASTGSSAGRSGSYNIVLLDEFAFVPTNIADEFFKSVFPTISSGQTSKVIIISTPNGMNLFYKKWTEAINGRSNFIPVEASWWDVPGRDEEWKKQQLVELGESGFLQEHGGEFLGATNTLINAAKLKAMPWEDPVVTGEDTDIYQKPIEDHIYVLCVDVSEGQGLDASAFTIIDVTQSPYRVVAKYRSSTVPPLVFPSYIAAAGKMYNDAYILVELNGIGQEVSNILHYEMEYENLLLTQTKGRSGQILSAGHSKRTKFGVKTTQSVKATGCANLKAMVEGDTLLIPDFDIISELTTFVAQRKSFAAESGCTDDLVMSLVIFSWLANQKYFKELTDLNIRMRIARDKKKRMEEQMLPFGFIVDGRDEEITIDSEGNVWENVPDFVTEDQLRMRDFWHLGKEDEEY